MRIRLHVLQATYSISVQSVHQSIGYIHAVREYTWRIHRSAQLTSRNRGRTNPTMVDSTLPRRARTSCHGNTVSYGGGSSTWTLTFVSQNTVAGGLTLSNASVPPPPTVVTAVAEAAGATGAPAAVRATISAVGMTPFPSRFPTSKFGSFEKGVDDKWDADRGRRVNSPVKPPLRRSCRRVSDASPSAHQRRASKPTRKYSTLLDAAAGQGLVLADWFGRRGWNDVISRFGREL